MIRIIIYLLLLVVLPDLAWSDPSWSPANNQMGMPSPSDKSVQYLGYVFGVVNGVLHGTGSQIMGAMFAKFNAAVLVLGGVVVIYTTLMGILNTAQEGEFLGKKMHSVFVPLRTIMGILLIAPTSTGYSWIQVILMWIVLQGVTAANMVWEAAVEYILNGGTVITQNQNAQSTVGTAVFNAVKGTMPAVTCMNLMQRAINQTVYASSSDPTPIKAPLRSPIETVMDNVSALTGQSDGTYPMPYFASSDNPIGSGVDYTVFNGLCGKLSAITLNNSIATNQVLSDLNSSVPLIASTCNAACFDSNHNKLPNCPAGTYMPNDNFACNSGAMQNLSSSSSTTPASQCLVQGLATESGYKNLATHFVGSSSIPVLYWCSPPNDTTPNYSDTYNIAAMDYMGLTYSKTGQANTPDNTSSSNVGGTINMKDAVGTSWFSAGAFYFALLQSNEQAQMGQTTGAYTVTLGTQTPGGGAAQSLQISQSKLDDKLSDAHIGSSYQDYFNGLILPFFADVGGNTIISKFSAQNQQENYGHVNAYNMSVTNPQGGGIMYIILNALMPGIYSMITSFTALLTAQNTNSNPLLLMMMFGNGMLSFAFEMWFILAAVLAGITLVLGLVPCVDMSTSMEVFTSIISPFITTLLLPMFVTGAMLLYYLPAVPFMIFTFASIGWIIAVIESMVAAPIVGFAIMAPEGQHDIFGRAEAAVNIMLNIFLRPSLMIFGLITGIMVSYIGVWIVNDGFGSFLPWVLFAGDNLIAMIFFLIAIPMVYLIMVFQIVNRSFALIHILPDKVTRWITGGITETFGSEMAGLEEKSRTSMQSGTKTLGSATEASGKAFSATVMDKAAKAKGGTQVTRGTGGGGTPGGGGAPGGGGMGT